MVPPAERSMGRLAVRVPLDLLERVYDAAELSHITVDEFVARVLTREIDRWEAQLPPRAAPPPDLQRALDDRPDLADAFAALSRRNHAAFLHMIESAKRSETRARRVDKVIAMLSRGENAVSPVTDQSDETG